jgi:phosphoribosylformimino-5-aminoimidazole carboxamide ribotide isomerase
MIVYPAIDLRGGQVVRLKEGDPNRQTVFSSNPHDTARRWIDEGATWLHMVNLDGAFQQANSNLNILQQTARLPVKIQFGGGLRSLDEVHQALDSGASRVVLGTVAVENPDLLTAAVEQFGADQIAVALDARDGKVTTHGWQNQTDLTPIEFGREIAHRGVRHALFTDVRRDGTLIGSNVQETIFLGRETGLQVIASGGVSSVNEIQQLARSGVVAGVIIGMALYEDRITLAEALLAAKAGEHAG